MRDTDTLKMAIERQVIQPLPKISIVSLVDLFVEYAYSARASDVHIQPEADGVRVRFRIDGILRDIFMKEKVSRKLHQELITRIKVMSGMRTDEHMAPQDGRFKTKIEAIGDVDVRVSIMPTYYGENAVMRILATSESFGLKDLGFSEEDYKRVEKAVKKPYGMILANGPTGSGKTTTLYSIIKELDIPDISIITIEDPIEYSLSGTTQIQVNNTAGLTFANGLRSILRQDPNVVMVGEIRDAETASIAVNAALTGHLVLTTLHTNDAATTFPRLIDMGVPPFLVSSTINIAMGQRLVRRICEHCKKERVLTAAEVKSLSEIIPEITAHNNKFFRGEGCANCGGSGYMGRIGVHETLELTREIRQLIMEHASSEEIKQAAMTAGMATMLHDGYVKALAGVTSLEEVLKLFIE